MFGSTGSCRSHRDILSGVSSSLQDLLPAPLAGRHVNRPPFSEVMAEPGKAWFLVRLNWGTLGRLVDYCVKSCRVSRNTSLPNGESQVWEKRTGVGELADPQLRADLQLPAAASGKALLLHVSMTPKLLLLSPPVAGLQTSFSGAVLLCVYQGEPGTAHCELFSLTCFLMA